MKDDPPAQPPESPPASPRASLLFGSLVYAAMFGAAWVWLQARDRESEFARLAIGEHGPWIGSGAGLLVGCVGAFLMARFGRRARGLRELERLTGELFRHVGDRAALAFLLVAALAEEMFFRLACQDAMGLAGSVAAYVLLNSSMGGLSVVPFTALHALVLGLLVQQGFGLLGSTTAHAIMNYLSLRRILCT